MNAATFPPRAETLDAIYYEHAARLPSARRVSFVARRRLCRLFFDVMQPGPDDRVLDVGVSDEVAFESNMLEQLFPYPHNLTCASLTNGQAIERAYPGITHQQITPHEALPFADNSFDIVYSNAVLEHAGNRDQQRFFLNELCRVARRRFVVVPNPLFPVEHHTGLPLVNYLPARLFRLLLRRTRYTFWSHEENLNYLSASALRRLWPCTPPEIAYSGIGFGPFQSNLAAYNA
jgi:hypothetical protein